MRKLYELASMVRSKNAAPFMLTVDIIFPDNETYEKVLDTGVLDRTKIAKLYGVPDAEMQSYNLPLANAVKFSFPRKYPAGNFFDDDLYGCQKHAPLVFLDVPID